MAFPNTDLWFEGELACFEYLTSELQADAGKNAFIAEIPPSAVNVWFFEINGQGEDELDFEINMDSPGCAPEWGISARVFGRFINRRDAQILAGQLRSKLPITEDGLQGVHRLRPRTEPRITKGEVPNRKGGVIPVWELEYKLWAVLKDN